MFVFLRNFGMELTVLIDAQAEEFGISQPQHVFVLLDNHGMDMPVLYAPTEKLGTLTQINANALSALLGMV